MIKNIKQLIKSKDYTCVVADEHSIIYKVSGNGVKPIITPMRDNKSFFKDKYIADTKVGKAAALLFALSGAKYVYGEVISQKAISVLEENDILFEYDKLVEYTKNREGTGMCPLEECVQYENNPKIAWTKIENKISELMSSNK